MPVIWRGNFVIFNNASTEERIAFVYRLLVEHWNVARTILED